jgi:hypothetical protein
MREATIEVFVEAGIRPTGGADGSLPADVLARRPAGPGASPRRNYFGLK